MVTVDTGELNSPLAFLLESDLEPFDDGDALCNVKDNLRLLGEHSFHSLLKDLLLFTTITDERCSSSCLEDKQLQHADDPLFDDEQLRAEVE